jgi:hypothetical protein
MMVNRLGGRQLSQKLSTLTSIPKHLFLRAPHDFLSSRLVKERDTGAVHGEDGGDGEPTLCSDLVAMGFGDLLDQSVSAEQSQLTAYRGGSAALLFLRERTMGIGWPVQV